jgi:hypothetical protein
MKKLSLVKKLSFLFLLAFGTLVVGFSQVVLAGWGFTYNSGSQGGSSAQQYTCTCSGMNTVEVGLLPADLDRADTVAKCECTALTPGQAQGTCDLGLTWKSTPTGDGKLLTCDDTSGDAVISGTAKCADAGSDWVVSGMLKCLNGFTDLLGFEPPPHESQSCVTAFGKTAEVFHFDTTVADTTCSQAVQTPQQALTFLTLSDTKSNTCHSQGGTDINCGTRSDKHIAQGEGSNTVSTQCNVNPNTVNTNCTTGKGKNDSGGINVCWINKSGVQGFSSFDENNLDGTTATMNGFFATSWTITDCDGDGVLDFQARFPSCSGRTNTVPTSGDIYAQTNFNGQAAGVSCTEQVATN